MANALLETPGFRVLDKTRRVGFALRRFLVVLRSTSVCLGLGYAVLFATSSLFLVGFLWWLTAGYLDLQADTVIAADAREMTDQVRDFGLPGAIEAVHERIAESPDDRAVYLLADRQLKPIAGNLPTWPGAVGSKPGSYQLEILRNGQLRTMRLLHVVLPDGLNLLVGRDVEDRAELRALIVDGLFWAGGTALLLAIGGGILVRRAVLDRVGMINNTASAIVRGDLTQRIPTRETADAFDQLADTINRMLQQIHQLVDGVRNTVNAVAHDLRTPLAELRARLEELLRTHPASEAAFDEIHRAIADIDRVIAVFNALLRLAEIDSGARRSGFRRVELADLVTEVAELYAPLIEEKGAVFAVDAESGLAVSGDPYLWPRRWATSSTMRSSTCHPAAKSA